MAIAHQKHSRKFCKSGYKCEGEKGREGGWLIVVVAEIDISGRREIYLLFLSRNFVSCPTAVKLNYYFARINQCGMC